LHDRGTFKILGAEDHVNSSQLEAMFVAITGTNLVVQGLVGGIIITLLNALGALGVTIWRKPSERVLDASLGFAAGAMLAASFTSLILPGIEYGGIVPVIIGILLGSFGIGLADQYMPHTHAIKGDEGGKSTRFKGVWLFIIAITLHNMPEGLAVGVSFGTGDTSNALSLMIAIGLQKIPEGLAVAVSALSLGTGTLWYAVMVGIRAGLVEIPMALFGAWAVQLAQPLLPYAMGFAAGAMLYVISDEIVPETHRKGHELVATIGTILGVVVMLFLNSVFG
jgi:zinc transporter, ZIP family